MVVTGCGGQRTRRQQVVVVVSSGGEAMVLHNHKQKLTNTNTNPYKQWTKIKKEKQRRNQPRIGLVSAHRYLITLELWWSDVVGVAVVVRRRWFACVWGCRERVCGGLRGDFCVCFSCVKGRRRLDNNWDLSKFEIRGK